MEDPFEWKGSRPQRFSGGKRHLKVEDQFGHSFQLRNNNDSKLGIRTFSPAPTPQQVFKPHQKIFEDKYNVYTKNIDLRGIKSVQLPEQKQRIRPQKLHLQGGKQTYQQIQPKGIKSFEESNKSKEKRYIVEDQMQRKVKFYGLQSLRNDLTVHSLGDKSYKYPEYSTDFYKDGGLIAGSTQKPRRSEVFTEIKRGSVLSKPNWDVKVKMDEALEQQQVINSIDEWEKTTLKQNNPKWNDPDTFFERMEAQAAKDGKKGGKK